MAYEFTGAPLHHRLELDGRERLTVSGVEDVARFDETCIVMSTCVGSWWSLARGCTSGSSRWTAESSMWTATSTPSAMRSLPQGAPPCCPGCSAEGMENYVSAQLLLLGQAALLGMLGGVVYDLLRPLRRGRLIHLTDALFTGGRAGADGVVPDGGEPGRGTALFLLLGACGGAGLYFLLLAPLLRPLWDFWAAAAAAFGRLLALPLHFGVKLAKKSGIP